MRKPQLAVVSISEMFGDEVQDALGHLEDFTIYLDFLSSVEKLPWNYRLFGELV